MAFPLFAPRPASDQGPLPPNTRAPRIVGPGAVTYARGREIAALLLWTVALFLSLALGSYADSGEANWVGPVGEVTARALVSAIGIIAWSVPLEAVLLGIPFVRGKKSLVTPARVAGDLLIVILAAALVQVGWSTKTAFGHHVAGGA